LKYFRLPVEDILDFTEQKKHKLVIYPYCERLPKRPPDNQSKLMIFKDIIKICLILRKHNILLFDLKPDNLLLLSRGNEQNVVFADFDGFEIPGTKGRSTEFYLSPECSLQRINSNLVYSEKNLVWTIGMTLLDHFYDLKARYFHFIRASFFPSKDPKLLLDCLPLAGVEYDFFVQVLQWDPEQRPSLDNLASSIEGFSSSLFSFSA